MRVLYATDGRVPARNAGLVISRSFDPRGVQVDVLTVMAEPPERWIPDDGYDERHLDLPPHLEGEEIAQAAAESLDSAGFVTTFSTTTGIPSEEILRAIETTGAGVVVLGGSRTSWMANTLLGSTSLHVLHHAPCPVLIAHEAPEGSGKVLLGIDSSAGSEAATTLAAEVLDPNGCSINVVTSVTNEIPSVIPPYFGAYATVGRDYEERERQKIERARSLVQRTSSRLAREGFDVHEIVLIGSPGPQLLKEVDNVHADLLIVGSRGAGALRRTLLGSVSDQVVRHAPATLVARIAGLT